jgi:hypothetical protein
VHVAVVVGEELAGVEQREADVGERVAWEVQSRVVDVVFLVVSASWFNDTKKRK